MLVTHTTLLEISYRGSFYLLLFSIKYPSWLQVCRFSFLLKIQLDLLKHALAEACITLKSKLLLHKHALHKKGNSACSGVLFTEKSKRCLLKHAFYKKQTLFFRRKQTLFIEVCSSELFTESKLFLLKHAFHKKQTACSNMFFTEKQTLASTFTESQLCFLKYTLTGKANSVC